MRKRLLATALCVMLVMTLLPTVTFAATPTVVKIAGTDVSAGGYWKNNGDNSGVEAGDESNWNAHYDNGTLYLNDLNMAYSAATEVINAGGNPVTFNYAICADGDLKLNLSGINNISTASISGEQSYNIALGVNGDLTVEGEGMLSATSGQVLDSNGDTNSVGIYVLNNITAKSGTIEGIGNTANGYSAGVFVAESLVISGGSVIGTGKDSEAETAFSIGVDTKALDLIDGNLTGTGGYASGDRQGLSLGVYAQEELSVSSGVLTANGGEAHSSTICISAGIFGDYCSASFNGGIVTATGGFATGYGAFSEGIYTPETITVSGGSITAVGGDDVDKSAGAQARAISISGGTFIAIGGNATQASIGVVTDFTDEDVYVSGGTLIAKVDASCTEKMALLGVLTLADEITAQGSTLSDGSNSVDYSAEDNDDYLWISAFNSPTLTVEMSPTDNVNIGDTVTLTAIPAYIAEPTYQWYSNTEDSTGNAAAINGATSETYTPATDSAGTVYYYCVANGSTISNVVGVTVSPAAEYSISVLSSANGSIESNKASAKQGDTVTLTVTPDNGYKLKQIKVLDDSGADLCIENGLAITNNAFQMPDVNVQIQAVFEETGAVGTVDELSEPDGKVDFDIPIPDDCVLDIHESLLPDGYTPNNGETAVAYSITLTRDDTAYPIDDNPMTIVINLSEELAGFDNYHVSYLDSKNQLTDTQTAVINGTQIQFTADHLGDFIVEAGHTHTFGGWTVTKAATATQEGIKERSCSVCGHKETAVIAATGTSPDTGNTDRLTLWITLILTSGGLLTALAIAKRKHS